MILVIPILVCASLLAANAMPTNHTGVFEADLAKNVLVKRIHGSVWKPLNDRHHQWQFPKYVECGKPFKDIFGHTGYDGDYLMKETWDAAQRTYNPASKSTCQMKVDCYRGFFIPYSNKNWILVMNFKVKDDVQGVGQVIQFSQLYVRLAGTKYTHTCTYSDAQYSWWQVSTGNQGHEDTRVAIDKPPPLSI